MIQGRCWLFQLVSAVSRYDSILTELAQIEAELVQIKAKSTHIPKKKTQTQHQHVGSGVGGYTLRWAASSSGAAPSQPRR